MKNFTFLIFVIFTFNIQAQIGARLEGNKIAVWFEKKPDLDGYNGTRIEYQTAGQNSWWLGYMESDTTYFNAPPFETEINIWGISFWERNNRVYHIKSNVVRLKKEDPVNNTDENPFWHKRYGDQLQIFSEYGFEVIFFTVTGHPIRYNIYPGGEIWLDIPEYSEYCSLIFKTNNGHEIASFKL